MSTQTNMHYITTIDVTEFDDHEVGTFTRIRFEDKHGNAVVLFPEDMAQFIADICTAAENKRIVRVEVPA